MEAGRATGLSREQVRISKRLALVLRHRPETAGLTLDAHGWVAVADLLTALLISRADLDLVVAHNDKARFAITVGADGVERIRARQGHSRRLPVDLGLPAVQPPEVLFHGTPVGNIGAILRDGLRPGRRHHVHLSVDVPTALAVGRRRSPKVAVFEVATTRMADHGHVFHRSDNGVWLTAAVPPDYLSLQPGSRVRDPRRVEDEPAVLPWPAGTDARERTGDDRPCLRPAAAPYDRALPESG